jgi:small-conductance mechanosensitive channel
MPAALRPAHTRTARTLKNTQYDTLSWRAVNTSMTPNPHHLRHGWFLVIFLFCAAIFLTSIANWIITRFLRRKQSDSPDWGILRHLGRPARVIFLLTCVLGILPLIPGLPDRFEDPIRQGLVMTIVACIGWFFIGCVYVVQDRLARKYELGIGSDIKARRVRTQFQLIRRLIIGFIVVVTIGALLYTFDDPRIWHYGSGLLASAGIASLILATALRATAANILAGIQIAFTEPLRLDDTIAIGAESGKVEEINSAYIVIRLSDLRRLIVPLSFFIENAFQNWSRDPAGFLGYAFLYVDYSIPVEELRQQLERILRHERLWDGKAIALQVTNLTERTMELRCTVSARNSAEVHDLRCIVREQMTAYIQQHYPTAFPTTRLAPHQPNPPPTNEPPKTGTSHPASP